jgi:adenine-specific DNA-methyltransferase
MGEHAKTHCAVRLKKVIDGEQGGISEAVGWQGGGGVRFYTLGDTIFDEDGQIRKTITFDQLAAHIWFYETKTPFNKPTTKSPFLGIHNNVVYALLYNGILHDKRVDGGNVLTSKIFDEIYKDIGGTEYDKLVIYGEASRIGAAKLKELNIEFKQTPYDVRAK